MLLKKHCHSYAKAILSTAVALSFMGALVSSAQSEPIAKKLFGSKKLSADLKPASHGFYSKGCIQGAEQIEADGPTWQAMRLSRNRRWGHPKLINLIKRLSVDGRKVGWNGLLVGDISQPRGGPMLSGHASHQIGLDADIWLNPMPNRRLSYQERQNISAKSMLGTRSNGKLTNHKINKKRFTQAHFGIIKTAASYKSVERVLVHPVIKRELCRRAKGDRAWLQKVRPYWGHHYHMHIRIGCPAGSPHCRPQGATVPGTGCGKALDWWFNVAFAPPKPRKKTDPKPQKSKPKRHLRMKDLPNTCRLVLNAPDKKPGAPQRAKKSIRSLLENPQYVTITKPTLPHFRPRQ